MNGIRMDAWLWAARFFKTRTLSKKACELGRIRSNGQGKQLGMDAGRAPTCGRSGDGNVSRPVSSPSIHNLRRNRGRFSCVRASRFLLRAHACGLLARRECVVV